MHHFISEKVGLSSKIPARRIEMLTETIQSSRSFAPSVESSSMLPSSGRAPHQIGRGVARAPLFRGLAIALLAIALCGLAGWAKGRGYKTRMLRRFLPESAAAQLHPTIRAVRPSDHEGGVSPYAFIACDVTMPNSGRVVDGSSLEGGVRLFRTHDHELVASRVNTTGGGDAIVLRPIEPLRTNTEYTFEVLPAVHDSGGASFEHYAQTFTTASGTAFSSFPAAAVKVPLPQTQLPVKLPSGTSGSYRSLASFTGVTVGPDGRLYASASDGRILRYGLNLDGTVSSAEVITTIQVNNHADRLLLGLRFDPRSTASNLVLWASHGQAMGEKQDDWTGKISRLSGENLERYQDYVVGLPRAKQDHATDQMDFGPDGCLYFGQASNTAMGAPDHEWGYRPEHLLTACILRLDTNAVATPPLDARTEDAGNFNPLARTSPLTIYATGIRNAYDLVWHSNGRLYAPVNGSAAGGNSPASPADGNYPRRFDEELRGPLHGPTVPALRSLTTQSDFLFSIEKGGYYGHPNPSRAEYVLNGGNPTGRGDLCEVRQYPVGTLPDRNWRRPIFDFGKNLAPCGILEYRGAAFPALRGKLLVARYSGGKDIFAISLGRSGEVTETLAGIDGFTSFFDPLDICEDPRTGFLYVAEFGGRRITLLRPSPGAVSRTVVRENFSLLAQHPPTLQPLAGAR